MMVANVYRELFVSCTAKELTKSTAKNDTANPSQSLPSKIQTSVKPDSIHVVSRPLSREKIRTVALLAGGPHAASLRHNNATIMPQSVEVYQEMFVS